MDAPLTVNDDYGRKPREAGSVRVRVAEIGGRQNKKDRSTNTLATIIFRCEPETVRELRGSRKGTSFFFLPPSQLVLKVQDKFGEPRLRRLNFFHSLPLDC